MKYILLTDIHFGCHGNSDEFNQNCLDFLQFVQDYVDEHFEGEDILPIFMGDWYHNRNTINVKTLNYGVEGLRIFDNLGNQEYSMLILGNHDLYFKDRRDTYSPFNPDGDAQINIVDEPLYIKSELTGNHGCLFVPWLLSDENISDLIKEYNPEFVFGHFEFPSFKLNNQVVMEGEFNPVDLEGPKRIFSGHFHLRSSKANVYYIGNCFSHDFSDSNEWHNKGFGIFDPDTDELEFVEWKDAPKYCVCRASNLDKLEIGSNMKLKLINNVGLEPKVLNQIQEELLGLPQIKECLWYPENLLLTESDKEIDLTNIPDVNIMIGKMLSEMDMKNINNNKLINIYNDLEEK